ncbi:hypothetical protein L195_g003332 [Trifolium pratense]|uniref:Retrotransposon gag domain-containing protein n=1 Tax=Trifolium pratense TaxID=57577 RepID=A0A2K3NV20_TRIPR|nr:hypothetical protein L195_g003332 [Trifolium pratense]
MLMALTTKNKDEFVDGSIEKPSTTSSKEYRRLDYQHYFIQHYSNVHLFHIEKEIHECIQGDMSIGDYYPKLKSLWDARDAPSPE